MRPPFLTGGLTSLTGLTGLLLACTLPAASGLAQQVPPCRRGRVSYFAGTSCSQRSVTYTFPRDFFSFSSTGLQPLTADQVRIGMDPQGPYTMLIGFTDWDLNAPNESFTMTLHFSVTGGDRMEAWMHHCYTTGTGEVTASITVKTNPPVSSTAVCNATTQLERAPAARYTPGPVDAVVTIKASSGNGTAGLRSLGTHFGP